MTIHVLAIAPILNSPIQCSSILAITKILNGNSPHNSAPVGPFRVRIEIKKNPVYTEQAQSQTAMKTAIFTEVGMKVCIFHVI